MKMKSNRFGRERVLLRGNLSADPALARYTRDWLNWQLQCNHGGLKKPGSTFMWFCKCPIRYGTFDEVEILLFMFVASPAKKIPPF